MTFEEQFEQLQKMFDSSDCDIEVLPPDEEKAKKLRAQGGEFTPLAAILAGTGGAGVQYGELPCGELLRAGRGTEKAGRPAAFHVADDLPAFPGAGNAYGTSLPRLFNTEQRKISQIRSILWISH